MSPDESRPIPDGDGYGQLCAVGFALDAIGDRWTPLLLRDLARAPLRFRDLQAINPGISPNLLTRRLRKLEGAGLIEQQPVPFGNGHRYALTDQTRNEVQNVLTATANLGAFLIDRLPTEDLAAMDLPQILARQMELNGHFVNARPTNLEGYFVLDMTGVPTYVTIGQATFHASSGPPEEVPVTATLTFFPPTTLMRLMARALSVSDAESEGLLQIDGDRSASLELLRLLSFEPPTNPYAGC